MRIKNLVSGGGTVTALLVAIMVVTGGVAATVTNTVDIGDDEDGDLAEWSGHTGSYTIGDGLVSGSDYSIVGSTDGSDKEITKDISTGYSGKGNISVAVNYSSDGGVREFVMQDDSGVDMYGLYGNPGGSHGLHWSAEGEREGGPSLIDNGNLTAGQTYHITIDPHPDNDTATVFVDGEDKGTFSTVSSTASDVPDALKLSTNGGSSTSESWHVDAIMVTQTDTDEDGTYDYADTFPNTSPNSITINASNLSGTPDSAYVEASNGSFDVSVSAINNSSETLVESRSVSVTDNELTTVDVPPGYDEYRISTEGDADIADRGVFTSDGVSVSVGGASGSGATLNILGDIITLTIAQTVALLVVGVGGAIILRFD
ncbi:hypothetical protein SAMN04487948_1098 [Halogranum amylolyticum]|uniref:Uncharacterized protein n=1 Tax=Halogranum amylolyticum TaxID=660520 RepID=A0A1H8U0C4_9EURY|nr:hypothetical protein [Halogranum amylolyticum]SEO96108.1 hypothetical protein SAMN04487948_1098 [Halogranum amylolyticum]